MDTLVDSSAPANAAINRTLSKADKITLLRDLCRIRRFEQTALKYYNLGRMGGFLHLYSGQEAVAIGTISLLGENDHVITAYRDHGHALAMGDEYDRVHGRVIRESDRLFEREGGINALFRS